MKTILCIANAYGNIEKHQVPAAYVHVAGLRLQPLCRKLGIKHAPCLVGWTGFRSYRKPVFDGVVVHRKSEEKLRQAIADREARAKPPKTPEQKAAAKKARQEKDVAKFAAAILEAFPSCPEAREIAVHACEIGSGRVGRSSTVEDAVHAAVVAHVRHVHTDYEDLLDNGFDVNEAREKIREQIGAKLNQWQEGGAS